jgi:WD40 repeat protein
LAFWPDGKRLVSSDGPTLDLWDISNPAQFRLLVRPLRGNTTECWSLALLPEQATLVSGCKDGSVWVWDTAMVREEQGRVVSPRSLCAWRFTPDSHSVLTLDQQGHVATWTGNRFQESHPLFDISTNIFQANFSGDGAWLAVAPTNGWLQVWDLPRRGLLSQFACSTKRMTYNSPGLLFLERRQRLLTLDWEDVVHEWDFAHGVETRSWRGPADSFTVAVTPDERWCLTLGRLRNLAPALLKDLATGAERTQTLDFSDVEDAAFSPDGRRVAGASSFGGASLWQMPGLQGAALPAFAECTFSVCFSPDGRRLATGGTGQDAVTLWDVESGQAVLSLKGLDSMFWPTAFSPDGNIIGSMNFRGVLHLWRAPSWDQIAAAERDQNGGPASTGVAGR